MAAAAPSSVRASRAQAHDVRFEGVQPEIVRAARRRRCGQHRPGPEANVRAHVGHVDLPVRRESEHPALQGRLAVDRYLIRVIEARAEQDVARCADDGTSPKAQAQGVGSDRGDPAAGDGHGRHEMMLHRYVQC